MKKFNFKGWAKAAGVRAIKTVAQTAGATIGVSVVMNQVDWMYVLSASVLSGILSLLMSVKGLPELDNEGNIIGTEDDTEVDEEE